MLCCEGVLGKFVFGGVQAEGVVEGGIGGRGGLEEGGDTFVSILDDGECFGCSMCIGG